MLYPVEHCAMTALAFRQDAEIRALPKMSPKQLASVKKTLEARAFERGDHMPDGTILSTDRAVRAADPYDTRDYLMPTQDLLKNVGWSGGDLMDMRPDRLKSKVAGKVVGRGTPVDIGGHCHSVAHPSQPLTNPKKALEWLNAEELRRLLEVERVHNAQQREAERWGLMTLKEQRREQDMIKRPVTDQERLKFAQEYIIQDPRQPGKVESSRKATIRAAFEAARIDELHTPRLTSEPTKHLLANPPAASWPTLYEIESSRKAAIRQAIGAANP